MHHHGIVLRISLATLMVGAPPGCLTLTTSGALQRKDQLPLEVVAGHREEVREVCAARVRVPSSTPVTYDPLPIDPAKAALAAERDGLSAEGLSGAALEAELRGRLAVCNSALRQRTLGHRGQAVALLRQVERGSPAWASWARLVAAIETPA